MYCTFKMHFTVLCTLLGICVSTKATKPRSINVALDTVFEFDKPSDVDFIDQLQGILNKVKNILKDNPKRYRTERYKVTNFFEDAIDVLQSFNDEDLREIVLVVNNEIRKHLKGNALEEKVRRFSSDEYNRFKIRPIKKIRKDLDQLSRKVKDGKHKNNDNNFLGFINTLYKRDSEQKLARFIRKLKMFRRNNFSGKSEKLQQAVRRLLSSVIFEHFYNLPEETKRKFVAKIENCLHDAVYKDEDNHSSSQKYEIEAQKFNEAKNESKISSGTLDDKEKDVSLIQDQNKSRVVEVIRDQSGSSKEIVKKESKGTSGETSSETNNAKINFKRKIKRNNKTGPSKKAQRRYQNMKMKLTQYSKELEKRSSGEIIRKVNTKYTKSKITHSGKLAKNSNLTNSRRKFTYDKTFYPKYSYIGNDKFNSVFRNTKHVHEGNIEKTDTDEIVNDITLSSISNSAEININFKNNKMQFSFKDRDDSVEDTVVRAKDSKQNPMASRAAEKQPDKRTNRQIDSQDSIENRLEISKKRFKTVNRTRRLFKGHNNVDKYLHRVLKLVEYEQDNKFNINKIDNFKKNVNTGIITTKKSPKIDDFRRRDYLLAKELIADKLNARKKLEPIAYYNTLQYAGDHTVEETKSREKFNNININDISTLNKPDETLAKASNNNNFVDDFHISKIKPVNRFTTKGITYHEQQDSDNYIAVNTSDTNIRSIELTTENETSYRRTKEPDKIDEVSLNHTRGNKNVQDEFNINNISNNIALFNKTSIANKSTDSYKKGLNAEYTRKLLIINAISTTKMNKIIESKKETKIFKPNHSTILVNTKPNTKSSTPINTNSISEILKYGLVTKPIAKINKTNELKENEIKSNVTKLIDSRRILSTPKATTLINLDANLDDLAFEATMADVNTIEADSTFDIKKYLKNRGLPVGEDDPKNEIAKKMKEDLENIFTMPVSSASTTAAYTDIFEALENAFDL